MSTYTIGNASNIPLNAQQGTIPNLGSSLLDWFQQITFGLITKAVDGYQNVETVTDINFWGVVHPLTGRQLAQKPEGQRKWNWLSVTAQASPAGAVLELNIDDIILYMGIQYRVMTRRSYALYSYIYYELAQDYSGSVPTP